MFNSTTLEVAIGLVFCYSSVAFIVSSINEAIASFFKLRSGSLLDGVKSLLNDPNFEGLALNVYNHALVSHHDTGNANSAQDLKSKPSYIDPKHFAIALIDNIQTIPGDFVQLGKDIDTLQNPQLKQLLQSIYGRASGQIETVHTEVAAWFDAGMDRLSGNYKRRSQVYCFFIALVIAILFNVDSFYLFKTLWLQPTLASGINGSMPWTQGTWQQFMALPVGWGSNASLLNPTQWLGWLVTAAATLFGAPFWFDILQKLVNLRGTGNKPALDGKQVS